MSNLYFHNKMQKQKQYLTQSNKTIFTVTRFFDFPENNKFF